MRLGHCAVVWLISPFWVLTPLDVKFKFSFDFDTHSFKPNNTVVYLTISNGILTVSLKISLIEDQWFVNGNETNILTECSFIPHNVSKSVYLFNTVVNRKVHGSVLKPPSCLPNCSWLPVFYLLNRKLI